MSKIYVVTEGEYSDYHIEFVTTKKEIAEDFVQKYSTKYKCFNIEEYFDCQENMTFYEYFSFVFDKEGDFVKGSISESSLYCVDDELRGRVYPFKERIGRTFETVEYHVMVFAKNYDKAFKIACDRLAEYRDAERNGK